MTAGRASSTPSQDTEGLTLHAWVDESMRIPPEGQGEGTYLLAAVVADPSGCDVVREVMRKFKARGAIKLHWHEEGEARRRKISAAVAEFDMCSLVVVGMPLSKSKQERARVQCLTTLLVELDGLGVTQVFLENRTQSLNTKDRKTIDRLRGRQTISKALRVDMARPSTEPMLWIPDVVAGAVGAAREGQTEWLDAMTQTITQIEIPLR